MKHTVYLILAIDILNGKFINVQIQSVKPLNSESVAYCNFGSFTTEHYSTARSAAVKWCKVKAPKLYALMTDEHKLYEYEWAGPKR